MAEGKPLRKVTYRLSPSRTQATALLALLVHHQQLYNAGLEQRIDAYRRRGVSLSYEDQCRELTALRADIPAWAGANCSSQQITLRRLDKAMKAFFRRVAKGQAAGFPRFKALTRFPFKSHGDGWRFTPGTGWQHGKLRLQGIGVITARGQARPGSVAAGAVIKPCELMHSEDANGKAVWHLSLTIECVAIRREAGVSARAFDWGVDSFLTTAVYTGAGTAGAIASESETDANPRWYQSEKDRLTGLQQAVSRTKRGSNSRRKAVRRFARAKARAARRRHDWQHKLSASMVAVSAVIATEQLSVKNMTRSATGTAEAPGKRVQQKAGLNREILDTAPSAFLAKVRTKAEDAGCVYLQAPTRTLKPSQTCPACGAVKRKSLSDRVHVCAACGHTEPRDAAAARVILAWALRAVARVDGKRPVRDERMTGPERAEAG